MAPGAYVQAEMEAIKTLICLCLPPLTLAGCCISNGTRNTADCQRDRQLYRAMRLERRALALEYGNLTNVDALQGILDRNGAERSKLEGLWK